MIEERTDYRLTFAGRDGEAVAELMRTHAEVLETAHDVLEARALRLAADEFESGGRTYYSGRRAHYVLDASAAVSAGGR